MDIEYYRERLKQGKFPSETWIVMHDLFKEHDRLTAINRSLEGERDEADRRAGAAERLASSSSETIQAFRACRDKQKESAGYQRNVSFDIVWAETLAKANRAEAAEALAERLEESLRQVIENADFSAPEKMPRIAQTAIKGE